MNLKKSILIFARYALALAFLSAVADRLGLWGEPGARNVFWGNYTYFLDYTALLNPWAPKILIPWIGGLATVLEIVLAAGLMIGYKLKEASLASGILLVIFAVSMACTLGIKTPFDYSVLSAAAAAFLIYTSHS